MTLRAMDDIKETVRLAAQRAGRSLAAASTKMCDYGGGASPARMLNTRGFSSFND